MAEEAWKPVVGYEGVYEISDLGKVKSLPNSHHKTSIILKSKTDKDGYKTVTLRYMCNAKYFRVNRLVLIAFVSSPPFNGAQGNHINGIKSDNRLDNLEWETNSGNQLHSYRVLGNKAAFGENHGNTNLTSSEVIDLLWKIADGATQSEAGKSWGVPQGSVSAIWHGKCWKYLEIPEDLKVKMKEKGSSRWRT